MGRYLVVLGLIAIAVGGLFRAVRITHIPVLEMAGTIGVFLMGVVGTLAVIRYQSLTGRKRTEEALQALGPQFIITDWAEGAGPEGAPDYLLVAPAGLLAVTLDGMPQGARGRGAQVRLAKARERATACTAWLEEHLQGLLPGEAAPIQPLVILTRRQVQEGEAGQGVPVINAEHLPGVTGALTEPERLNGDDRVRVTRHLRKVAAAAGKRRR